MTMKRWLPILLVLALCIVLPAVADEIATPIPTPAPTYSPEQLVQLWYLVGALLRENGDYPYVALQKGDSGYEVRALQTRLAELGYYSKKVVDEFGTGTYTAMRLFERVNRLTVDGVASVLDQKLLFSSLAENSNGAVQKTAGGAATPKPTATLVSVQTVGLQTLNPDLVLHVLPTATPAPSLFIPELDIPDFDLPMP